MWAFGVVEGEVAAEAGQGILGRLVIVQIDLLVLDAAPEALDEDVVEGAAAAIHTDLHACGLEARGEREAGELGTLIGVEDLGRGSQQGPFQRREAEAGVQRHRQLPGQHVAAEPVQDGHEEGEAVQERDVGDIRRPDLVGSLDRQAAQQIGKDPVARCRRRRARSRDDGRQTHPSHQPGDPLVIDRVALGLQPSGHLRRSEEGRAGVLLVDPAHQRQIELALALQRMVERRARQPGEPALGGDGQSGVGGIDP